METFIMHLTPLQDFIIVGVPVLLYIAKMYRSPSQIEAAVLTRLLLPLVLLIIRRIGTWHKNHPTLVQEFESLSHQVSILKTKTSKKSLG